MTDPAPQTTPTRDEAVRYRKKPVVIDAWKWAYGEKWPDVVFDRAPDWLDEAVASETVRYSYVAGGPGLKGRIFIQTLEGEMAADFGDWIIKGVKGELYPCKPEIFEATYELASAPAPASGRVDAVKALEWKKVGLREWRAITVFGDAVILEGAHGDFVWRIAPHTLRNASGSEKSLESAQAVLWANYEARIRSALSPAATPVSEAGGEPYNVSETHMLGPVEGGQS